MAVLFMIAVSAVAQNVSGKCYRGYLDVGYTIGIVDYKFGRVEVNTSHGFQFNPFVFLGGGVGMHFMPQYETPGMSIALDARDSKVDVPVFGNLHINFAKSRVAPFVDLKCGYYVNNNGGLYANCSLGFRIATSKKQAINLSAGYTREELEFETFKSFNNSYSMNYSRYARKLTAEGVTIKLGYEF